MNKITATAVYSASGLTALWGALTVVAALVGVAGATVSLGLVFVATGAAAYAWQSRQVAMAECSRLRARMGAMTISHDVAVRQLATDATPALTGRRAA